MLCRRRTASMAITLVLFVGVAGATPATAEQPKWCVWVGSQQYCVGY